jgi:Lon protease-like protein
VQENPKLPVPVFPLPSFVLFPHVHVPLHVFELRYRALVRDALAGERVIAMAVLRPGWERDYHFSPEFHPLGCLARFDDVEWLPDDCYNLRLLGLSRVRFGGVAREYPYRSMRVEVLPQDPFSSDDPLVLSEKHALLELCRGVLPTPSPGSPGPASSPPAWEEMDYEGLVNAVCMAAPLDTDEKLKLLAMDSVIERGRRVREMAARQPRRGPAPPRAGEGGERN